MESLLLLVFYSLGLFLVSHFLLDVEGMMVEAFNSNIDIEFPVDTFTNEIQNTYNFNRSVFFPVQFSGIEFISISKIF